MLTIRADAARRLAAVVLGALGAAGVGVGDVGAQTQFFGPTAYLCGGDSPFAGLSLDYFHLETFEDHLFNVPGVVANQGGVTSVVFGPSIHDSVDCDDGNVDGSGLLGDSFFGGGDMRFTFSAAVLGTLPTHAGVVWTDGGQGATVIFEAYDAAGLSLGTLTATIGDGSVNGTTAEDRFFGISHTGGVSAIRISHNSGGLEIDHLQYGGGGGGVGCAADFNGDGFLDFFDYDDFVNCFETGACPPGGGGGAGADFNGDGFVDFFDYDDFVTAFEIGC